MHLVIEIVVRVLAGSAGVTTNSSDFRRELGVSRRTVARDLDFLRDGCDIYRCQSGANMLIASSNEASRRKSSGLYAGFLESAFCQFECCRP